MANSRSTPVGTSKVNAPPASTLSNVGQTAPSHKPKTGPTKWLSAKPLRSKLKFLMACVCNTAFLSAALVFFAFDFITAITQLRASSAALGKVIGTNSRTVLSYGYKQSAATIIASLSEYPNIIGAGLYKPDGTLFARTMKPGSLLPSRLLVNTRGGTRLSLDGVMHYEPIAENGKPLGMLVIESDLAVLHARLKTYGIATICILLCAALFSRWLALRLDKYFVAPVAELANVAKAVTSTSDYGLRAQKYGEDEIGVLVEHFNTMLGEIQKRDAAITQAHIELETKVLMRTSELHHRMAEDKSKQELIAENESRYRNLFENNPMPMFVVDLESLDFLAINNAAMKHYGYSQNEFLRLSLADITETDDYHKVIRAFRSSAKSFNAGEWKHRRKHGEAIEVELTAHAILFSGKVAKIVLANDVTARKEAQRQLDELHRKLLETTRQAGMAEVATGVLHNVGNVLNSVNVSATVLSESVRNTKATSISRVVELFETNKTDLPGLFALGGKGQMLPDYLATLSQQIAAEQKIRLSELSQLTKNIAHIKDIVAMQQNYAKITGVMDSYPTRSLLDEAVQLATADNKRDGVALEVDCPTDCPEVYVDRHKVMQILINLLTNARQAIQEQSPKERLISVAVTHNTDKVRISVRDNGCGISPENLTRIFNHGFTTKKTGHGFGLHSAANSAKEMGGQLFAESEGMGHGSAFNLELPIRNPAPTSTVAQTSKP